MWAADWFRWCSDGAVIGAPAVEVGDVDAAGGCYDVGAAVDVDKDAAG